MKIDTLFANYCCFFKSPNYKTAFQQYQNAVLFKAKRRFSKIKRRFVLTISTICKSNLYIVYFLLARFLATMV